MGMTRLPPKRTFRLPVTASLDIEDFVGGTITSAPSRVINGVFAKYPDGRMYITQRPAVNILEDCSETVADVRGRGCFYWSDTSEFFMVNNGEVYKGTYATTIREAAQSVVQLTQTGTTVNVEITGHGLATGDTILIAGADDDGYNGRHTITVFDANNVQYTDVATLTSPDTGVSPSAQRVFGLGTEKVYFHQLGDYLAILDPENGEGWYLDVADTSQMYKITDGDFPSDFVRGGYVLNGRLYIGRQSGSIVSSAEGDPTNWNPLDAIEANHSPDVIVSTVGHRKHITAFGANTIEFFYDNGNPQGSPLSKRVELVHELGAINGDTFWTDNDITFFVGISKTGGISVYALVDFQIKEVSTPEIASYISTSYLKEEKKFMGYGAVVGGRAFYCLTVYTPGDSVTPVTTLVYNALSQTWTIWDLAYTGIEYCPLVDWTISTDSTISKGILTNGDIVTFQDDFIPQDLYLALGLLEDGIVEDGIVVKSGSEGDAIALSITLGAKDFETRNRKSMSSCRVIATQTQAAQTMTLSWSDENNTDFNAGVSLDMSVPGLRARRLGSFRQRNFRLAGSPTERVAIEGLEVEVDLLHA